MVPMVGILYIEKEMLSPSPPPRDNSKEQPSHDSHDYQRLEQIGFILVPIENQWIPMDTTTRFFEFGLQMDSRDGVL